MFIWRSLKNDKVHRIVLTHDNVSPGTGFEQVPNNWGGSVGDYASWFDPAGHRIPDIELVQQGLRKDNRGLWFNTTNIGDTKTINKLDEEPGKDWTQEKPLEQEAFQIWDQKAARFVVDMEKKETSEKQRRVMEKQVEIEEAEKAIQRPLLAIQHGTATVTDTDKFEELFAKIKQLREERKKAADAV